MKISEQVWNKFEAAQLVRERVRLIRSGRIKLRTKPIVMVFNEGKWKLPAITGV